MMSRPLLKIVALSAIGWAPSLFAQPTTPAGWKWVTDRPATMVETEAAAKESAERLWFVQMPPGFHITMGPGGSLYHPTVSLDGRFELEGEFFLFPGESASEYGFFVGGSRLEEATGDWVGFVVRRDGSAGVIQRRAGATESIRPWQAFGSIVPGRAGGTARNVLKVIAGPEVVFQVNGAQVARIPRDSVNLTGLAGFRIGSGVNLHVTSFDVLRRLAPVPPPRK
ncbi:MAG: hypothetical protein FJ206_14715 [Gemmatimonadetes bacterium]|nr:hypothetical protein [Gemmatimonadota bacterium]